MKEKIKIIVSTLFLLALIMGTGIANAQAPVKKPQRPTTSQSSKPQRSQPNKPQKIQSQKHQNTQQQNTSPQQQESQQTTVQMAAPATSGVINGHEWVDLDLPSGTKWATCNIGANSPSDYGDYYAWGETSTKISYTTDNSQRYGDKLGSRKAQGVVDSKGNLTARYDAARQKWGGTWRMPTNDEIKELVDECRWKWTTEGGKLGYKVTGPNGNSIFLPAAGYRNSSNLSYAGSNGYYWSATAFSGTSSAYILYLSSTNHDSGSYDRGYGRSVRPVTE